MAFPLTISSVAFAGRAMAKPWLSSDKNVYVILLDSGDNSILEAHKATDPSSSFSNVGTNPNLTNNISCYRVAQQGDLLHVFHQEATTLRAGRSTFNMATDTWDTSDETIESPTDASTPATGDIAPRSDKELVVIYNGDQDKEMGTLFDRADYSWYNGSTWSTAATIGDEGGAPGVETDWVAGFITRGLDDRMHFTVQMVDFGSEDLYIRTLSGAATPVLESMQSVIDDTASGDLASMRGIHYYDQDDTAHRVCILYKDGGTARYNQVEFTSADAPTYGSPTVSISDTSSFSPSGGGVNAEQVEGDIDSWDDQGFLAYSDVSNGDLRTAIQAEDGSWANTVLAIDVSANSNYTDIQDVFINVFDRGNGPVIGCVLNDNGTIKYTELNDASNTNTIDIEDSFSTLADTSLTFPQQNCRTGPFPIDVSGTINYYSVWCGRNLTTFEVLRATTTPTTATNWSSQDNGVWPWKWASDENGSGVQGQRTGGPGAQDRILSLWTIEYRGNLYITTQQESGRLAVSVFQSSDNTFALRDYTIAVAGDTNFSQVPAFVATSCAMRFGGKLLVGGAFNDGTDEDLRIFEVDLRDLTSISVTNLGSATPSTASTDYAGISMIGPNFEGNIYWNFKDHTNSDSRIGGIDAADTFHSGFIGDSAVSTGLAACSFASGMNDDADEGFFAYMDSDSRIEFHTFNTWSEPSSSLEEAGSNENVLDAANTSPPFPMVSSDIAHYGGTSEGVAVYGSAVDEDLRYVASGGTNGDIATLTTFNGVSCKILDNIVHIIYRDGTTNAYTTLTLTAVSDSTSSTGGSANYPSVSSYSPPYRHSNGNIYWVYPRWGNDLMVSRATTATPASGDYDQIDTRTPFRWDDGGNKNIASMRTKLSPDGNDIYVITQLRNGEVYFHIFEMDNNAWSVEWEYVSGPGDTADQDAAPEDFANAGCAIGVRADGDIWAIWTSQDLTLDVAFLMYSVRTAGSWATPAIFGGAASGAHKRNPVITGPDASDRLTCIYLRGNQCWTRSLSSADALGTDTQVDSTIETAAACLGEPVMDTSDNVFVIVPQPDNDLYSVTWASGAAPTPGSPVIVDTQDFRGNSQDLFPQAPYFLTIEGDDTIHCCWVDAAENDIQRNTYSGSWGTAAEEQAGTYQMIYGTVNDSDNDLDILRLSDSGTTRQWQSMQIDLSGGGLQFLSVGGTVAPAGAIISEVEITRAGSIAPVGVVPFVVNLLRGGSITPSGAPTISQILSLAVSGTITPVGDIISTVTKTLAGSIAPVGSLIWQVFANLVGSLTPSGTIASQPNLDLDGSVTPTGDVVNSKLGALAVDGSIAPVGDIVSEVELTLPGALTPVGALAGQVETSLAGSVTPVGVALLTVLQTLTGSITPVGGFSAITSYSISLAGSITPVGDLLRAVTQTLTGAISPAGALVHRLNMLLSGEVTPVGASAGQVNKDLSGSVTPSGALDLAYSILVSGVVAPVGALIQQVNLQLSGSVTPTGANALTVLLNLAGTIAGVGDIISTVLLTLTGSIAPAGEPNPVEVPGSGLQFLSVAGTITPVGTLISNVQISLAGAFSPVGTLASTVTKSLSGVITPTGTLILDFAIILSGLITPTGALVWRVLCNLAGMVTPVGSGVFTLIGVGFNISKDIIRVSVNFYSKIRTSSLIEKIIRHSISRED